MSASKSFVGGMYLVIAETAAPSINSMLAQVTSYSGTTLIVNVISVVGSGTIAAWTISQSALITPIIGNQEAYVVTHNGYGATNTKIPRFTTSQSMQGTDITYADSAANGASFTINTTGIYSCVYQAGHGTGGMIGWSVDSTELTTAIISITDADRLGACHLQAQHGECVVMAYLTAGQVLRPHTDGTALDASSKYGWARVRRVN